jgi:multiple sugar transport system ATP-binding protein
MLLLRSSALYTTSSYYDIFNATREAVTMAEIAFEDVSKRYADGTEAVRNLSLEIADGEFIILLGPSGCGKTTVLRMLAGLESVTSGAILIDGKVVNNLRPKDRDIAMVFQNYALYPNMTVRGNMAFALSLARFPKSEIERKVREVAEVLGLTEHLDRRPARLSGGQRQRVAMGRAIVREPKVFLMDEPLSNLDTKLRVQMRAEIAQLQDRLGVTSVYVTHDQTEAMTLGDRVVVMRDGVVQQVGTPLEVYQHPANVFVASFIGSPAINLFRARRAGSALQLPFAAVPLGERSVQAIGDETDLIVGLRPQVFREFKTVSSGERSRGISFEAPIVVLEPMGTETYGYCHVKVIRGDESTEAAAQETALLPVEVGRELNVRLDAATRLQVGDVAQLWFERDSIHLFATDGRCLLSPA